MDLGGAQESRDLVAQKAKDAHSAALAAKIQKAKEERELKKKLASIKTLGDSSDEEGDGPKDGDGKKDKGGGGAAKDWVAKSRANEVKKKEKARLEAELKRRQLEAMDDDAEDSDSDDDKKAGGYTAAQLKGLKVKHQAHELMDGETVVLTLEDRGCVYSPAVLPLRPRLCLNGVCFST